MRALALIPVLLALIACQDTPAGDANTPLEPVGTARLDVARKACEQRGGSFGRGGLANRFVCFERPRDAGKSCTSSSDCESLCLARSRTCAPVKPMFGCHEVLMGEGRSASLCVD